MLGMVKKEREYTPEELQELACIYRQELEVYTLDSILRVLDKGVWTLIFSVPKILHIDRNLRECSKHTACP